jgi:uncharacterized protein
MKILRLVLLALFLTRSLAASDAYVQSVEAWRARRLERLTKPDGWLTLIGLHWLQAGDNTVGRAEGNRIRLAAGPAQFGTINLGADGKVTFTPATDPSLTVDGQPARKIELVFRDEEKPIIVRSGTVSFFVVQRSEKIGLRVKDSSSASRRNFTGLDYFAIDPAWRIEAQWVAFDRPREIKTTNVLGQTEPAVVPGKAVFVHEGQTVELWPIDEEAGAPLFFVISDQTSGTETYAAGRFIYSERPKDGKIIIDFNEAYNPPCAFTPFATCPLPPKENRLPFAVRAGEKKYRGARD